MNNTSPSANGAARPNENRTVHNESINTEATPGGSGGARPRPEPQLPHDIDESVHSQASASTRHDDVGKQAYEDTLSPSQDTDKGPVLDAVYNDKVAPDRGADTPRR
ncbi:MAG: hypothetical protein ACJ8GJ_07875 [Vitreoscilla sp.]